MSLLLSDALSRLYDPDRRRDATVGYCQRGGIEIRAVHGCGAVTVHDAVLLQNRRIALPDGHGEQAEPVCSVLAMDRDGESPLDLVAWPLNRPTDVRTLLGKAPMLGLWQALNPMTYTLERPLQVYRTPLDWLRAGCDGAVVVVPELAAMTMLEIARIGGRIAAQDFSHERDLKSILRAMIDRVPIVSPRPVRRAA